MGITTNDFRVNRSFLLFLTRLEPYSLIMFFCFIFMFTSKLLAQDSATEINMTIQHNRQVSGTLLFADSSQLIFWQDYGLYDPDKLAEYGKLIHFSQIQQITFRRKSQFLKGVRYGALIGVVTGALLGYSHGDDEEGLIKFSAGDKAFFSGVFVGGLCALVGGIFGAAAGVDLKHFIGGDRKTYLELLPQIKKFSQFSENPPKELMALLKKSMQ